MILKFYYGQTIFFATNLDEIKSFKIKEIFETTESTIRLAEPKLRVGVLFENNEFSIINFDNIYKKWEKSYSAFVPVAISIDQNEVFKILAKKIISKEEKEIENLEKKIENSCDLIRKAKKYL